MHPGQDGSELFVFQTALVLRIGRLQKLEAIPATGELKLNLKDVLILLYMLCLRLFKIIIHKVNLQTWLPCFPALELEPVRYLAARVSWCCCCFVEQPGWLWASSLVLAQTYTQLVSSQLNCWILLTQVTVSSNKTTVPGNTTIRKK